MISLLNLKFIVPVQSSHRTKACCKNDIILAGQKKMNYICRYDHVDNFMIELEADDIHDGIQMLIHHKTYI